MANSGGATIEKAIYQANHSGLDLLIIDDDFQIIDILKSIKQFQNSGSKTKTGIEALRDIDNFPKNMNMYTMFKEGNVYFVLLKFANNDDGGLLLYFSTKKHELIKAFTTPPLLDNSDKIVRWLIAAP